MKREETRIGPSQAQAQLDALQCRRLLAGMSVGRVVYTVGALPAVLPVRYRLDGDGSVLLRVDAPSTLVRAVSDALVAFEAGALDETDGSGWTVTVLGHARVTRDQNQASIRIMPELVTGVLLPPGPAAYG